MTTRGRSLLLWILALAVMLGAAVHQRLTGPTHPQRGAFETGGTRYRYKLVRSGTTDADARVVVPAPAGIDAATLHWKRLGVDEPFASVPMRREGDSWAGALPVQPPAGKVEYFVRLGAGADAVRLPPAGEEPVVLRYKDPVSAAVLVPHVVVMFLSMLVGVRAGLAALFEPGRSRVLSLVTLAGLTVGGLVLGPIAQKQAFGAYWTGWPYGYDLTDNKVLLMWAVWAAAGVALLAARRPVGTRRRAVVAVAAALMLVVYMIPHSLRGSALDYEKLERGVDVYDAIRTG